jgi:hypothetical protein
MSGDKRDTIRKDTDVRKSGASRPEKDVVTEGSEESFPASDPPSFMAGNAIAGSPPSRPVKVESPPGKGRDKSDDKSDDTSVGKPGEKHRG